MPERLMPTNADLKKMLDRGMSVRDIADEVGRQTGRKVSVSTVTSALSRAGLTTPAVRHNEELPWRVRSMHLQAYPARMLRLLGRRRKGDKLTEAQNQNLNSWLNYLEENKGVVAYDPDTPEGFFYVPRRGSEGRNGVPVRRQPIDAEAMR